MRKIITFVSIIVFLGAVFCFAQQEEIRITTYYPSPHGLYDELGSNKLAVDIAGVAVPTEYAAMSNGDVHIGRALIVGAGGGSGFAFDEGATPGDGDVLIKNNVGIGTVTPGYNLEVNGTLQADDYYSEDGSLGMTQTLNVRAAGGGSDCTITVKDGLITASTCP